MSVGWYLSFTNLGDRGRSGVIGVLGQADHKIHLLTGVGDKGWRLYLDRPPSEETRENLGKYSVTISRD